MGTIDLDAVQQEVADKGPTVLFAGREYQLPPVLPFAVVERLVEVTKAAQANDAEGVTKATRETVRLLLPGRRGLFRRSQFRSFMRRKPSTQQIQALIEGVMPEYGLGDVGEPSASES